MDETGARTTGATDAIRIHPPLLAGILLVVTLILHLIGGNHPVRLHQIAGLLVVALGAGICCYAAALFAACDTTKIPYGEPSRFVSQMPYTFTRNPMYLGLTTILFGFAVFFGSAVMLLAPIVFVVVIDRLVIPREEDTMERLFGQQYIDYRQRVRRWL